MMNILVFSLAKIRSALGILFISLAVVGCTHGALSTHAPVKLRLVPKVGDKERNRYVSHSMTDTYVSGNLERKKREDVEFVVDTLPVDVDAVNNRIKLKLTTVQQDGAADLRDYAMPALDENIEMVIDDRTRVYSAGKYPPGSIFFVPTLSLPEHPVRPGDTWDMTAEWLTFQGVPLRMELVSVLKGIVPCGGTQCADIEVSGDVKILNTGKDLRFRSDLNGRYLFSIDRGLVLWSLVRSEQEIVTAEDKVAVTNCLLSRLEMPKDILWSDIVANDCEPGQSIPEKLKDAVKLRVVK